MQQGAIEDAFEAAKLLSQLSRISPRKIAAVLDNAKMIHNREAIVCAISWLPRKYKNKTLNILIDIANNANENAVIRAQALEGIGIQHPIPRCKL